MKLLLLNYEYPPLGGGAGNATQRTAAELARLGHTVHVLTSRMGGEPSKLEENGVTVHRVWSRRRSIHEAGLMAAATYLWGAFWALRKLARQHDYDLYHFYFALPTGLLSLFVRWRLKKPYVVALRGSDVPGYDRTHPYLKPLHAMLRPLSRYIWTNAETVTALSEPLRQLALETVPDVSVMVVGNGVDASVFPEKVNRSATAPLRLLTVCRLIKRKGLEHLIHAMKTLGPRGIRLCIAGTGEQQEYVANLVQSLGLADSIELAGYVPRDELAAYYHDADVFVLPSLAESFGLVLVEAMSCGLPIVATRVGGIPEIVDEPDGGLLINPGSAEAIVEAIERFNEQPESLRAMGQYNAEKTREEFAWRRIAQTYENTYRAALGHAGACDRGPRQRNVRCPNPR